MDSFAQMGEHARIVFQRDQRKYLNNEPISVLRVCLTLRHFSHPGCNCNHGYVGAHCEFLLEDLPSGVTTNHAKTTGSAVAAGIFALFLVFVFLYARRRRRAQKLPPFTSNYTDGFSPPPTTTDHIHWIYSEEHDVSSVTSRRRNEVGDDDGRYSSSSTISEKIPSGPVSIFKDQLHISSEKDTEVMVHV